MPAEPTKDELKIEIERGHFARAAQLAQSLALEEEVSPAVESHSHSYPL
jgi:hypothetical protein